MKSKKILILGISFVSTVGLLAYFGGTFSNYGGDTGREVIGYVTEEGTYLDLDGNVISEEDAEDEQMKEEVLD